MPKTLHAELASRSDADGVSLNQYIVSALARAVSGDSAEDAPAAGAPERERTLRIALIVNAVVVAIAAATAIALLIYAFR